MKKILFLLFITSFLAACDNNQPCNTVGLATKDYLNVKIVSSAGVGGFVANGYTTFEVPEVNQTFSTEYNGYYEDSYGSTYTSLKLPIAHNYAQTTFIFKGPSLAPKTILVNNYNARAELQEECGYRLTIDEPQIATFTFTNKSKPTFDAENKILTFQILK